VGGNPLLYYRFGSQTSFARSPLTNPNKQDCIFQQSQGEAQLGWAKPPIGSRCLQAQTSRKDWWGVPSLPIIINLCLLKSRVLLTLILDYHFFAFKTSIFKQPRATVRGKKPWSNQGDSSHKANVSKL